MLVAPVRTISVMSRFVLLELSPWPAVMEMLLELEKEAAIGILGAGLAHEIRNPLNAATFLGRPRIDADFRLKGPKGKDLGKLVYEVLSEVSQIKDRERGIRALAAYVQVRRGCVSSYSAASGEPGLTSVDQLAAAITAFVEEKSEGGGRAQAVVGGLFDVRYGSQRVRVGKTNEPDRRAPGDVVVGHPILTVDAPLMAVEVRDKAVTPFDVLAILQKLRRAGVSKGAIVAVAKGQPVLTAAAYAAEVRAAGVQLEIFAGWSRLVAEVIFWSDQPQGAAIREAVRHIRDRAVQMGLSAGAIVAWDGYCYVHDDLVLDELSAAKARYPDAKVVIHPEARRELLDKADFVSSTSKMVQIAESLGLVDDQDAPRVRGRIVAERRHPAHPHAFGL